MFVDGGAAEAELAATGLDCAPNETVPEEAELVLGKPKPVFDGGRAEDAGVDPKPKVGAVAVDLY